MKYDLKSAYNYNLRVHTYITKFGMSRVPLTNLHRQFQKFHYNFAWRFDFLHKRFITSPRTKV